MPHTPDIDVLRSQFPALARDTVLLENAGGSQVTLQVADAIRDHLLDDYVPTRCRLPRKRSGHCHRRTGPTGSWIDS